MRALKLTPDQQRALAELAYLGDGQLCSLGLPDEASPLVVHYESESVLIDEGGEVLLNQRHWKPRLVG